MRPPGAYAPSAAVAPLRPPPLLLPLLSPPCASLGRRLRPDSEATQKAILKTAYTPTPATSTAPTAARRVEGWGVRG